MPTIDIGRLAAGMPFSSSSGICKKSKDSKQSTRPSSSAWGLALGSMLMSCTFSWATAGAQAPTAITSVDNAAMNALRSISICILLP